MTVDRNHVGWIASSFRSQKALADRAAAQLSDDHFFAVLGEDGNAVATVVKHVAGNLHSRFTDFLTSDGEKEWRQRDSEFDVAADTRAGLLERWESGWEVLFGELHGLVDADLDRNVVIRGEPHSVLQALLRQLSHYSYHIGQIVLLARTHRGSGWESLSIPKGESDAFNRRMFGK